LRASTFPRGQLVGLRRKVTSQGRMLSLVHELIGIGVNTLQINQSIMDNYRGVCGKAVIRPVRC
jgi:hypothetical protein